MFSHMPWPPPVLAKRKNEGPTFLCSVLSKITPTTPSLERGAIVAYFLALSSRWSKLVAFIQCPSNGDSGRIRMHLLGFSLLSQILNLTQR
jgi:hypothetical protein